ncbi:GDSL-type esterase/lipase family protein [Hymenobacter setariae]|nr:GDSL-type esterase/lipase family protein [Hymenobacter setariae]
MQGGSAGNVDKWNADVLPLSLTHDVVALQEAGSAPPASSVEVGRYNTPEGTVRVTSWNIGTGSRVNVRYVYFLTTDPTGNRVNLALVTKHVPDNWQTVPPGITGVSRGALGVQLGAAWYYTLHGLSGNGNDDANLLHNIEAASGISFWVAMGDYNRNPSTLQIPPGSKLYNTGQATQQSGGELDYLVSNDIIDCEHGAKDKELRARTMGAKSSDHYPVETFVVPCRKTGTIKTSLRVMPLGASITQGLRSSDGNGYRANLYKGLDDLTSGSLDFVGRKQDGTASDPDNEGYVGARIDQIAAKGDCALPAYKPNLVTIIAGTNDMAQNFQVAGAGARLGKLIDEVLRYSPRATVLVEKIPPNTIDDAINRRITAYNNSLPVIIQAHSNAGQYVLLLDPALGPADVGPDHIHPTDDGYAKIADKFLEGTQRAAALGWLRDPEANNPSQCLSSIVKRGNDKRWEDHGIIFSQQFPPSFRFRFGDVNKDGRAEYFVFDTRQGFRFWWNAGPTGAKWKPWGLGTTRPPRKPGLVGNQLRLAQLDDDGRVDLAAVDLQGHLTPYTWDDKKPVGQKLGGRAHTGGVYLKVKPFPATTDIVFADLDGDGLDDYLLVEPRGRTKMFDNHGFVPIGVPRLADRLDFLEAEALLAEPGKFVREYRYADLNGDKRADRILLTAHGGAHAWLNTGVRPGGLVSWRNIGQIATDKNVPPKDVQFVDIDGDGKADFLRVGWTGIVHAWLNKLSPSYFNTYHP